MASDARRPPRPFPSRRGRAEETPDAEQAPVEAYRLTPKLARRVALLGGLVVIGFGALFMRLWALQVLAGSHYAHQAVANQLREVRVQAPRGPILDSQGRILVTNKQVMSVELSPAGMPKAYRQRAAEVRRIANVAHVSVRHISKLIGAQQRIGDLLDPIVIRAQATGAMRTYLQERSADFPGLMLADNYIRSYPYGTLAAQLLGYDGQITQTELNTLAKKGYQAGDEIGQTGIESALDTYLRGVPGLAQVRVNSLGQPRSPRRLTTPPTPGESVRLTINARLQIAAQNALKYGIQLARNKGNWASDGGAIVAMSPKDGSILAMASSPSYDPSVYSGRVTTHRLAQQGLTPGTALAANYPALDRALDGTYPPGSTFKPLTAIAGLEEHLINPYKLYPCTGTYVVPEDTSHHVWHNWDRFVFQGMDLPTAIEQSCDTYFYRLANKFYLLPTDRGQPIQKWARAFGFGKTSGSDLTPQAPGLVPTIGWKHHVFTRRTDPTNWRIDRLWKPGDSLNLAIGQGDLTVTPLQMARFYAAIANGGKLVTPHILMDVENSNGTIVPTAAPPAPKPIPGLNPTDLDIVKQGLQMATQDPLGTSYPVFGQFPISIAGKTGTAQKAIHVPGFTGEADQSWWCGYGPTSDAKIVVCAVIENGGEGGAAAAPAAEKVFAKYFNVQPAQYYGNPHSD